jgi:L-cysteine desulfidase
MNIEKILHHALRPAVGCTEPAAVAFAVAAAVQATAGWSPERRRAPLLEVKEKDVRGIRVEVNKSIFKNAFSIYIPNTEGHKGILMASALGVFCDPVAGLELFRSLKPENVQMARHLIDKGKVVVEIVQAGHTDLYIHAEVLVKSGSRFFTGTSLVQDEHTNLVLLKREQEEIFHRATPDRPGDSTNEELSGLKASTFQDLVRAVEELPEPAARLIRKTIDLNKKATKLGLSAPRGLGIGFHETHGEGNLDLAHYISSAAAAGSDARMSGYPVEVMSTAGSGNQGIIATMPIVTYCTDRKVDEDRLLKAVALAHLVTMYVTTHVGYLPALCGVAMKAGIGAACGLTYAMGGGIADICRSVKIMAASIAGVICDGAKPGCALKVRSSSEMAVRAACLAMKKLEVSDENGIGGKSAEDTIRNLARLEQSMSVVEGKVLEIMQEQVSTL